MSLTVQDLIQQRIFPGIRIMAGSKGIHNEILWINIMEILDMPQSVQPGELLFTTGYGLDQEETHKNFIPELVKRRISGIAIQVGYYIDAIPRYILNQADDLDFPVLLVPKELTFSEFLHVMIRLIDPKVKTDWSQTLIEQTFNLLIADMAKDLSIASSDEHKQCTQILLLEPVNYIGLEESIWQRIFCEISSFIQANSKSSAYHELPQHRWVFLTTHASLADFLSMFYRLNIHFALLSEDIGGNCFLGAEQLRRGDLLVAVRHAVEALTTLHLTKAKRGVCYYGHIDFLKMLGQIHRRESSIVLDNRYLQQLFQYDRINNSKYLQTLRVYLSNNCNVTQTARQLYLHRHTLINRLEKIEEASGLCLDDYYSRLYMSIALLFHDYFVY